MTAAASPASMLGLISTTVNFVAISLFHPDSSPALHRDDTPHSNSTAMHTRVHMTAGACDARALTASPGVREITTALTADECASMARLMRCAVACASQSLDMYLTAAASEKRG